jgi:hypothetical protein
VQPGVTLAAGSCFRPVLSDLVHDLISQLHSEGPTVSATAQIASYHEQVAVAFSFLLQLAPQLLGAAQHYFSTGPEPFARLAAGSVGSNDLFQENGIMLVNVAQASYRLLSTAPLAFREFWNWGPFFDLLTYDLQSGAGDIVDSIPGGLSLSEAPSVSDGVGGKDQAGGNGGSTSSCSSDVRWCAVQVARIVLQLSDASTEKLSQSTAQLSAKESAACSLR